MDVPDSVDVRGLLPISAKSDDDGCSSRLFMGHADRKIREVLFLHRLALHKSRSGLTVRYNRKARKDTQQYTYYTYKSGITDRLPEGMS